jgi:hypothetical protein
VHHFVVTISIMTNGNALRLLVQMHGLSQHDDGKVGQNMAVCQEWPLRFQSYNRFMGMLRACAASGNDDALLLLGLVKPQFIFFA